MTKNAMALTQTNLDLFQNSLVSNNKVEYGLFRIKENNRLAVFFTRITSDLDEFEGTASDFISGSFLDCPLNARNARVLRSQLEWLQPRPLGSNTSAGMGDRIGLATPGHVLAVRAVNGISPIFAQQSIREMERTNRTPQQVMDDATWGVFQEGWQGGVGADADHLKTPEDIDECLHAGYTFFTIDSGAHVNYQAETADLLALQELASSLPSEIRPESSGLSGRNIDIEGRKIKFDASTLLKAAVKYGRVVDHVAMMYRHLVDCAGKRPYEMEVSIDETDQPTSLAEHFYIASELKRLGVKWVSLAPKYVGRFEKGVDYIGDLHVFETEFDGHAAVARYFGGYKLSLHSGSDKFSIYPIANRLTNGKVHLKTAGTSYLEALRTIASSDPDLFFQIYRFARDKYETDRVSYHVSAELGRAPLPEDITEPSVLLNQFDAREILHVTFGSVLTAKNEDGSSQFHEKLMSALQSDSESYAGNLKRHFIRHLQYFSRESQKGN
jgi:hypothetical protein